MSPHRMKRPWKGALEDPFDFASIPRHDITNPLAPGATRGNGVVRSETRPQQRLGTCAPALAHAVAPSSLVPLPLAQKNEDYTGTFVFPNDFPSLSDALPQPSKLGCAAPRRLQRSPRPAHAHDAGRFSPAAEEQSKLNDLMKLSGVTGECRVMCFHPWSDITLPLMSVPVGSAKCSRAALVLPRNFFYLRRPCPLVWLTLAQRIDCTARTFARCLTPGPTR